MWPPGAWPSRKYLCQEGKGPLSLERCSPARTQDSVHGGLLDWAPFCSTNAQPSITPAPWLLSTLCLQVTVGMAPQESKASSLGHEQTSDLPGRLDLCPCGLTWKAAATSDPTEPHSPGDGVPFPPLSHTPTSLTPFLLPADSKNQPQGASFFFF